MLARRSEELDLAIVDVAEEVGCSLRQLQRVFREEGSEEPRAALLRLRMERARELLSRDVDPLPIRAVAPLVGYRQPSGLRQAFRRYWGINPSAVQEDAPEELYGEVRPPE